MLSRAIPAPNVENSAPLLWVMLIAGGACASVGTENPLLTIAALTTLMICYWLLRRSHEPPVLVFAITYQWLQVATKVFHADVRGLPVESLGVWAPGYVADAIELGLIGLIVMSCGIALGMRARGTTPPADVLREAEMLSPKKVLVAYYTATLFARALNDYAWVVLSLSQFVLALASVKWVPYFLLCYLVFRRRLSPLHLAAALSIEVVQGIGFFAGWKMPFFITFIAFLTSGRRLSFRTATVLLTLVTLLGTLAVAWTGFKMQFRNYVSQGSGSQAAVISNADVATDFLRRLGQVDIGLLQSAVEPTLMRIEYVDLLASVIEQVPSVYPYEDGALLRRVFEHVATPRLLFQDKAPLESDTVLTARYTTSDADPDSGTSIGVGYMAHCYIDFGPIGMFVPIFVIGLLWGALYKYFVGAAGLRIIGYGFATALLVNACQFEIDLVKLIGGMLGQFIVFWGVLTVLQSKMLKGILLRSSARSI